jgi:hypothetical protein
VARLRSLSVFGRAFAVRVSLRHAVPPRGEAGKHAEAALLRLVEALVQRLLGVGQAPQRRRPGGQRIRPIAQALDRIGLPPRQALRQEGQEITVRSPHVIACQRFIHSAFSSRPGG